MASSTTNLDLTLPVGGENVSRQIINANNVKIDEAVGPVPSGTDLQSQVTALNSNITTIHPTTELGTMSDLVSLINETASGLFVNCRIGATIVNKLCGVSSRQGTINAFKSNSSSDYIEYTVIDTEAVVYSGFYRISTDTATYNQLALKSEITPQALSLTDVFDNLVNNVVGSVALAGNVITIYIQGNGVASTASGSDIGKLKEKYRPKITNGNYIITPILSNNSPYLPVASIWIYPAGGEFKKYGSDGYYISVTYVING